jgi:hypothetical protein
MPTRHRRPGEVARWRRPRADRKGDPATRELERLVGVMLFVRLAPLRVLSRS